VRETRAARQASSTIPIVMTIVADPVGAGLVESLARPSGNVTGLTNLVPGLRQKYVELLKEALPSASRIAVIASPPNLSPDSQLRRELDTAAKTLGLTLSYVPVWVPDDFEAALTGARRAGAAGIIAPSDPVTLRASRALVQLALKHRLPGMYATREYVDVGGLMSYGASTVDLRRRAAVFVDKILKGAKPADLPVEQPTKFELIINLKTAKAIGLTIPPSLLGRADEVMQ
jgi:putative ABC transport system substrate-binding protein